MKKSFTTIRYGLVGVLMPLILLLMLTMRSIAQQPMQRVYATTETHSDPILLLGLVTLAEVQNPANAVDAGPTLKDTYSTLQTNVGLLGLGKATQNVKFAAGSLPNGGNNASTPVSIKIGTGSTVLNVLNSITIQATLGGTPVGTPITGGTLLGLLGGVAQNVVTFTPGANYDGVQVTINPVVDVGTSVNLYYAYFLKPATGIVCNGATEAIFGSTGSIAGALNSVDNPQNAIDGDPNTFAKINATVSALNKTFITALYDTPAKAGDSVRVILQSGNAGLLNVSLLSNNLNVTAFNDNTEILNVPGNSPLLNLQLLPGPGNKYTVSFVVPAVFNRIEVSGGGGLLTALSGLNVYEIKRVAPSPTITIPGLVAGNLTACTGTPINLSISPAEAGATYQWFTAPTGGSPISAGVTANGTAFSPTGLAVGTYNYYVSLTRNGCTDELSDRSKVTITIINQPAPPTFTVPSPTACAGSTGSISVASPIAGLTYKWYDAANAGTLVYTGTTLIIPNIAATTTYYVEAGAGTCISTSRAPVTITVNPTPAVPQIQASATSVPSGQQVILTATSTDPTSTFKWYTSAASSTPVATTSTYAPTITATSTFYVEAVSTTGCPSASRASVTITVVPGGAPTPVPCEGAITQTNGVDGVLALFAGVVNPGLAVDNDTKTGSTLVMPVGVAASTWQRVGFTGLSNIGDTARVHISTSGNLLSLNVLPSVTLTTFNGTTSNGDGTAVSNPILSLQLLNGGSEALITFVPTKQFDGIELRLNSGLVGALTALNFDYAQRVAAAPILSATTVSTCPGTTTTLTIPAPLPGITYKWYDNTGAYQAGKDGPSFTTPVINANTFFFAEANRTGCGTSRTKVNVNLSDGPLQPVLLSSNVQTCSGATVQLQVVSPQPGVTYVWRNGAVIIPGETGPSLTVLNVTASATYSVAAVNVCGTASAQTSVNVTVGALTPPVLTPPAVTINKGESAILTASSSTSGTTFTWYGQDPAVNPATPVLSTPTNGSNGTFKTPQLNTTTTFWVTATNTGPGACTSLASSVVVTVLPPSAPNAVPCEAASSEEHGVGGVLSVLAGVDNPALAVDNDTETGSSLLIPVGVGSYVYQRAIFSGPSLPGDKVRIRLISPNKLLTLAVVPSIEVTSYNGTTSNNDAMALNNPLISLQLLGGGQEALLEFTPTQTFDRVEVKLNSGLLGALTSVNFNYAQRVIAAPTVQATVGSACAGTSATLSVKNPQAGITYKWYQGATYLTGKDGPVLITNPTLAAGNYDFFVTASRNSCPAESAQTKVTVTILGAPVLPVASPGNPATTCLNSPATLSVTAVAGIQFNWYDAPTGGTQLVLNNNSFTTPASLTVGSHDFYVEAINADGCSSITRTKITIVVNDYSTPADITAADATICAGSNAVLTPTTTTVTSPVFKWYANADKTGPITAGVDVNGVLTVSGLTAGSYTYYVSVSGTNKCENQAGALKAVKVTVNDYAIATDITAVNQSTCTGTDAVLTPTSTTVTNPVFKWYANADKTGPITAGVATNGVLTVTGLTPGTYHYFVSVSGDNKCENLANTLKDVTVVVKGNSLPADITAADQTICKNSTASLTASTTTVTNPVFTWYSDAGLTTIVSNTTNFTTPALASTTKYYVTVGGDNKCANTAANAKVVTVTVNDYSTAADITAADASICAGSNAVLTPTSATVTTPIFKWYANADKTGPITAGVDANGVLTVSGLTAGTYTYYVSVSGTNKCENQAGALKAVKVTVNDYATATDITAADQSTCAGSNAVLTPTSATVTSPIFKWYANPDKTGPITAGVDANGVLTVSGLTTGTYTYYVSVSGTNKCENQAGALKAVKVTITDYATAADVTAADQAICAGSNAVLTPTSATVTSPIFKWYANADKTGPITAGVDANGVLTVSGLTNGTYTYYVSVSGTNKCENQAGALKAVKVTVTNFSTAGDVTAADQTICAGSNAVLTPTSATVTTPIFKWYANADKTGPITAGVDANGVLTVSGLTNGTYTYYVSVSGTNKCENQAGGLKAVKVTVNNYATATDITAADQSICAGSNAVLTPTSTTVTTPVFKWYANADKTGPITAGVDANGVLTVSGLAPGTYIYYVSVSGANKCENQASTLKAVKVTVNGYAVATDITAADQSTCAGSSANLSASSTTVTNPVFTWYSDAALTTQVSNKATFTTPALTVTTKYYVTVSGDNKCANTAANAKVVTVTIKDYATPADVTAADQTICAGSTAALTASSATAINPVFTWYSDAALTTVVSNTANFTTPALAATTKYYLTVSGDNMCANSPSTAKVVTVTVNGQANATDITAADMAICSGSAANLSASSTTVTSPIFTWYTDAALTSKVGTGATFTTGILTTTTLFYVTVKGSNKCENAPGTAKVVTVNVNGQAVAADITASDKTVCPGNAAILTASSTTVTVPTFRWYNDAALTSLAQTGATFTTPPISVTTQFYVTVSGTNKCENNPANAKVVTITVNSSAKASDITASDATTCYGSSASLSASSTTVTNPIFTWYSNPALTTKIFTGATFNTPALTATTQYYVTVRGDNKCENTPADAKVVTVTVRPMLTVPTPNTAAQNVCAGEQAVFTATSPDAGVTLRWYTQATGGIPLFTGSSFSTPPVAAATDYYVEAFNSTTNCSSLSRAKVSVGLLTPLPAPVVTVGATTASSVTFNWAPVPGAVGYQVSLDNGLTFQTPSSGAQGTSQVISGLKAKTTVSIFVQALGAKPCQNSILPQQATTGTSDNPFGQDIYVPNAFTPNGDGKNDIFLVYGNTVAKLNFRVFNQWGQLIFNSTSQSLGWDGTYKGIAQPVGVYVYYLEATLESGKEIKTKGTITLIR